MASKLAKIIADFRTSLATKISEGGTTATLQSATDDDGVALPAGKYFFTLDGDSSQKEHIVCDLVGTALTNIKSVSRQGVQTTGAAREHRIGASVVITNFAHILYINNLLDGTDTNEATIKFLNTTHSGTVVFTGTTNPGITVNSLTTVQRDALVSPANGTIIYNTTSGEFNIYQGGAWSVMASGSTQPDASTTVAGKIELATVAQQGTATANGETGAPLVPANANLVKTSAGAGDENKIPVLGSAGALADGFMGAAESGASKVIKSKSNSKIDDSLLGLSAAGSIPYSNATDVVPLTIGTAGQKLRTNSGATAPEWFTEGLLYSAIGDTAFSGSGTGDTTLLTYSIPANTLATGYIRITGFYNGTNSSGSNCTYTLKVKYGGTTLMSFGSANVASGGGSENVYFEGCIANESSSAQRAWGLAINTVNDADADNPTYGTSSIDSTTTVDITITITNSIVKANEGTLKALTLEIRR